MQVKDIFSKLYKLIFDFALYTALLAALLGALPYSIFEEKFDFRPGQFENEHLYLGLGEGKWNNDLVKKGEILLKDQVIGGESFASIGDYLYTGLADGRIVRMDKNTDQVEDFLRLIDNKDCCEFFLFFYFFYFFYFFLFRILINLCFTSTKRLHQDPGMRSSTGNARASRWISLRARGDYRSLPSERHD